MAEIWIIIASVGEYSNRREWPVCALEVEAEAREFCERVGALSRDAAEKVRAWKDSDECMSASWDAEQEKVAAIAGEVRALDDQWDQDYTGGASYHYCSVPLYSRGQGPHVSTPDLRSEVDAGDVTDAG